MNEIAMGGGEAEDPIQGDRSKNELATAVQIPPHMPRHVTDGDSSETVQRRQRGLFCIFLSI